MRRHPRVEPVSRLPHGRLCELRLRSRTIYFPTELESFGYPLAVARVRRQPVITLASVGWAEQVVIVDAGSVDETVPAARSLGAEVVEQPWLGFSSQPECVLRLSVLGHDWVYFADADEWVSLKLAAEIAARLADPSCAGFAHRLRVVFMDTWIRHCGWYQGSWVIRPVDRRHTKYDRSLVGERACVDGRIRRLDNELVDEDRKGLAAWLHEHVRYAQLESKRPDGFDGLPKRLRALRRDGSTRPLVRSILQELVFARHPGSLSRSLSTCTSSGSASSMEWPGPVSASTTRGGI